MVGMFVCLCLTSKKPSEQEFFVPVGTDLGVKLLKGVRLPMVLIRDWSVCLSLKMIHWHFTIHLPVDHLIDNRSLSRHTLYLSAVLLSGAPWTWADSTSSLALFFTIRKQPITSTLRFRLTPRAAAFLAKKTLSINKLVDNKNQEESNWKPCGHFEKFLPVT